MKYDSPLVTMREDERVCFDRAMDQWLASIKRLDLSEKDRVKGVLLAYQRQAFVFHEQALLEAHQRGRLDGMEENQRLRQIISECAEASGAFVSPSASLDFMALLPKEIASVRAKMEERP